MHLCGRRLCPCHNSDGGDGLRRRRARKLLGGSGAVGVDAASGKLLWSFPIDQTTAVIPTPIVRGDLVFFGHRGTFTHIGIYAGDGQFVHATHRGSPVMVTSLDADYYRQRYMTAVRLSPQ